MPPILGAGKPWADADRAHEQTTYWEWLDSEYAQGDTLRTCADCHMPSAFEPTGSEALAYEIANIQTETFPFSPNDAPVEEVKLEGRPYRRHTLTGINLFTLEMFCDSQLGMHTPYPGIPQSKPYPRIRLTADEALRLARDETVDLSVGEPTFGPEGMKVKVSAKNLAGHKLPSGVHFRRAFLSLEVWDGRELKWASGRTDAEGWLVDEDGKRLPSEFARQKSDLQPFYTKIASQKKVQIYEERYADPQDRLTISFLSLKEKVRDSRLLPLGWRHDGPKSEFTRPVDAPMPSPGSDTVTYEIAGLQRGDFSEIRASFVYQALPPYYLEALAAKVEGSHEIARLEKIRKGLSLDDTPIAGWKLVVAEKTWPPEAGVSGMEHEGLCSPTRP